MPTYSRLKAKATKMLSNKLDSTVDVFNQIQTAEYTPLLELRPLPTISKKRNTIVPEGGAVDIQNGEIVIDGSLEKTALYSRKRGRYLPGIIGLAGIGVRVPDDSTGHYEFGYGDTEGNRFGLEIDNGDWYTFIESAGNRYYRKHRSEWKDPLDGTGKSGINLDPKKGFVLRMPFGWYGYLSMKFTIALAGDREDNIIEIDNSGHNNEGVSIVQPDLPIFAEAIGGSLHVGGRQYGVFGRYNPEFRITSPEVATKTVGDTYEPVKSFRFKNATDVKWRAVPVYLDSVSIITDGNVEYAVYTDVDLTGATFTDIASVDPQETALQVDSSATSYTGGIKLYSDIVDVSGRGSAQNGEDNPLSNILIPAGSIVTLVARALSGTATVNTILRLREEW